MAEKTAQQNKKATTAKATATKPVAKKPVAKAEKAPKEAVLVRAHARSLRIAPRKMRLVTNLVKDMNVNSALTQLQFTNKKGAKMLTKLLQSAAANAENNFSLNRDNMFIKTITTDMGTVMKRSFPRARGSAFVIRRKLSHVNVILEEREVKNKKKKPAVVPKAVKPVKEAEVDKIPSPLQPMEDVTTETAPTPDVIETHAEAKEVHHENEAEVKQDETSPQNLNK